jgi:hypothetical protein
MGLFGSIFGKGKPEQAKLPLAIRETMFGDMPLDQWPPTQTLTEPPWDLFQAARTHLTSGDQASAIDQWQRIIQMPGLESRVYLQAWHFLRQNGQFPGVDVAKQVFGVVIEVGLPNGLDLLGAYADHTARYWNFSGSGVVWEHPDSSLNAMIDQLLGVSKIIVDKIGPWDKPRPLAPVKGQARFNFLTPSGLHFGQGPMETLAKDPLAGHVFQTGATLMQALIAKSKKTG